MTKKELIEKLQPYPDDTLLVINDDGELYKLEDAYCSEYIDYSKDEYPKVNAIVLL